LKHSLKIAGLTAAIILAIFLITRCGGNGGDSAPVAQSLVYTGKTEPVVITLANTPTMVSNVLFYGTTSSDIPSGVTTSEIQQSAGRFTAFEDYLMAFLHVTLEKLIGNAADGYHLPAAGIINNTVNCESGYYTEQGTIDDLTGVGTVTYNYYDCLLDGVTHDGRMLVHMNFIHITEDEIHFNATTEYVLMTYKGPDFNVSASGTLALDVLLSGNTFREQRTRNYVKEDNDSNKMYMYENYVITSILVEDYLSSSGTISITGVPAAILYDSLYGSLKVETTGPLSYSSADLPYPDGGGPMVYIGDNSSIQLSVESVRHAKLELDLDGNTGYEVVRYTLWTELETGASLDLTDSDGDGMHDSWEMSFGLDPNVDDAAGNLDGDGLTNIEEYQQGYDPNNASSPAP